VVGEQTCAPWRNRCATSTSTNLYQLLHRVYMIVYARRALRPYIACMSARRSEHTYRLLVYSFTRLLGA
jgi:hypothetical protein